MSTYIPLNALEILMTCFDSFDIHSICVFGKPSVSAFQSFNQIENWLNIEKVISKKVYMSVPL